jgi:hypothetical protein
MPLPYPCRPPKYNYYAGEATFDDESSSYDLLTVLHCRRCRIPRSPHYVRCPYCRPSGNAENVPIQLHAAHVHVAKAQYDSSVTRTDDDDCSRHTTKAATKAAARKRSNCILNPAVKKIPTFHPPRATKDRTYASLKARMSAKDRYHALSAEKKAALLKKRKDHYHAMKKTKSKKKDRLPESYPRGEEDTGVPPPLRVRQGEPTSGTSATTVGNN